MLNLGKKGHAVMLLTLAHIRCTVLPLPSGKVLLAGYVNKHEHKFNEPGFVSPSFVKVFPLKTEPTPKKKAEPEHFQMSTPPSTTPITRTPPGLIPKEFPRLESRVPTRQEERTIAQRNQRSAENAEDNARFLFGRPLAYVCLVSSSTSVENVFMICKDVRSAY